jgi:hypothetical protein
MRQKLYRAKCKDSAAFRLTSLFEKAFVKRVNLRVVGQFAKMRLDQAL